MTAAIRITSKRVAHGGGDPDIALMLRVQRDEPGAFAELVREFQMRVFARLFRSLSDRHQAEDLTQEVFLRLFRNRKRDEPVRPLRDLDLSYCPKCRPQRRPFPACAMLGSNTQHSTKLNSPIPAAFEAAMGRRPRTLGDRQASSRAASTLYWSVSAALSNCSISTIAPIPRSASLCLCPPKPRKAFFIVPALSSAKS